MQVNTWDQELRVAIEAAMRAGELAMRYQAGIEAEAKADLSPVTKADRECEQLIASMLSDAFPTDGLLGEEGTERESRSGRRWIIDPIDGTRDYVRGSALWANLIGLEAEGEIVAGVANLPGFRGLYTASRGSGAYRNGEPIRVSSKCTISEAVLCLNGLNKLNQTPDVRRLLEFMAEFWAIRCMGGCPDAMLVASGQAEIWIEPTAAPWDLAPLKIIIQEAGGCFFNLDGGSTIYGGNCIACTPSLEEPVKKFIGII